MNKDKEPLVSVIVPTYNRHKELKEAIESIQNQTYKNLEIIVVNDGGEDVKDIISSLNTGNIVYLKHSKNKERSAARNTGIKKAHGKYIAYLDDDDEFYPDHIATLVDFLEHSDYKVAYTDAYRRVEVLVETKYRTIKKDVPFSQDFSKDAFLIENIAPVLCFMHEKACIDEVGLFDESLTILEDWDLWLRMSRKFDFFHIQDVTAEYKWRRGGTTHTSSNREDYLHTMRLIHKRYKKYASREVIERQKRKVERLKFVMLMEKAENMLKAQRDEFLILIERAKAMNSYSPSPYYFLGTFYQKSGKYKEAGTAFKNGLQRKKKNPGEEVLTVDEMAYALQLSLSLMQQSKFRESIALLLPYLDGEITSSNRDAICKSLTLCYKAIGEKNREIDSA